MNKKMYSLLLTSLLLVSSLSANVGLAGDSMLTINYLVLTQMELD